MRWDLRHEQTVLLFFGAVSPYKNVPHLITTFRDAALPDTIMLIAGRADPDTAARLKRRPRAISASNLICAVSHGSEVQTAFLGR